MKAILATLAIFFACIAALQWIQIRDLHFRLERMTEAALNNQANHDSTELLRIRCEQLSKENGLLRSKIDHRGSLK